MEHQLAKLKEKREQLSQTVTGMTTANDQQDTLLSNCRNEYRRVRDQSEKIVSAEVTSVCELNEI
jgi:F0F1-type ATP synthase delta subunit